ncbi:AcrR family transcriptional regulator [Nocardia sp. GAS34]
MRRLAETVGRDLMVIYRHVPNKAAVIDGVAEVVFAELSVDAAEPDWVAEVRRVAREFRRVTLAHPCEAWFRGVNDVATALLDPDSNGCSDGLEPTGSNENQSAEATLALISTQQQARWLARRS